MTYNFFLRDENQNQKFTSSVLVKYVRGALFFMDYRLAFNNQDKWGIGVGYRTKLGMLLHADIKLTEQLKLAYVYEFPMNEIGYYSKGSSEVILRFRFQGKKEKTVESETETTAMF